MPPVKSRREQYSEATRAALLDAATRRFARYGYAGTALEDVASDIQATRGAVYHHFAGKTALFQAVVEALEADVMARILEAAATEADPWDGALAALDVFLDRCCDPVYGRVVWQEGPIALGWKCWHELELKYAYGLVEQLLLTLQAAGHLPALPLEPMTRITFHILGAAGMALAEAPEPDKARVRAEYRQAITHLLAGARVARP
ncbi:TetR/AcrR family transcriptional regulator [Bailinhaonella thermotolerans]|uniref:TetR family transcriptional regulator n=1 Tax=Bailinhaonella thermotolerans TaxID=1070861 RepID=A0A3A4B0H9_9ACTN|nr:TetR/AcrR family transcriptional regulator [Bailinhaonella thermotolerans]RJL34349.1 TetR family transcriptional regulator [Bailinhaonella thermotolerans]